MLYENIEQLPSEIKDNMSKGAQQIFLTAYQAASSNGMNDEGAIQVAWNSVKNTYQKGDDGKWYRKEVGDFTPRGTSNMAGG
jgi:cation transport regulator